MSRTLRTRLLAISCAAVAFGLPTIAAAQSGSAITAKAADPSETGDGTMSPTARRAMDFGALPANLADVAAKDAADRAAGYSAPTGASGAADGSAAPSAKAPVIVGGLTFAGQFDGGGTPPDTTGAVGPTRYIQLVNRRFGIYAKNGVLLSSGTLNQFAGLAATINSFDPQVHWDPTSNKFYYTMDSIFSASDNRLSWGFSKTSNPTTAADFCKYTITYGAEFPDYPKMGDSQFFSLIGVNTFKPSFLRSDLFAIRKPVNAALVNCPAFPGGLVFKGLRDSNNQLVFTPVPADSVDTFSFGYVIARNLSVPSTRLWNFPVTRNPANGNPVLNLPRVVNVPSYSVPPSASQPTLSQVLDTLDTRPTQAVLARNPARGNALSLWTQHTVRSGNVAAIRFYEIASTLNPTSVLRTGLIASAPSHLFNAAISPDRRIDGGIQQFGGSFVVGYSVSGPTISPRIVMGSSVNGGAVTFALVVNGAGPYRDFSCAGAGQRCRWGDYSGANPDPRPPVVGPRGMVWLTNQLGSGATGVGSANWRTRIWAARP